MSNLLLRFKGVFIAIVVLALSASLAFGAQAPVGGWSAAGTFEKNQNVGGDEETTETEGEESAEDAEDAEDAGDNCLTDPTTATPEDLEALSHGQVVCWAAHQTEWPEWFANKGKFVSCWAHQGKEGAPSCTEAPAEETSDETTATHGKSAKSAMSTHSKGKGSANHPNK